MTDHRAVLAAVVSGASIVLLALIGLQVQFAISWGLLTGALLLLRTISYSENSAAPPSSADAPRPRGSDVSRLAWSINARTHVAGHLITRRVSAQLHRRLAQHGLDPEDPAQQDAVHALIGAGTWERLHGPRTTRHELEIALTAIERLSAPQEDT